MTRKGSSSVLHICGNPYVGRSVSGMLRAMGFTDIRCVDEADRAFEEIVNRQPDIIIADLDVQGVRGAEPDRWRGTAADNSDPIIVFVGSGIRKPEIEDCMPENAGLLHRPFDQGMLRRSIDNLLRTRQVSGDRETVHGT